MVKPVERDEYFGPAQGLDTLVEKEEDDVYRFILLTPPKHNRGFVTVNGIKTC